MATLSLFVRKDQQNADGTYTIKVAVRSMRNVTYIATRYKIDDLKQWKDGCVVRHPDAEYMNRQLRKLLREYDEILDELPSQDVPATDIRRFLLSKLRQSDSIKQYAEEFIARLKSEGRDSYAQNLEYTVKYLAACMGESFSFQQVTATTLKMFERYLRKEGSSDTTINIRMTHLKALLNSAVTEGIVEYKVFPFRSYKMPEKRVREIWLTKQELRKLRGADFSDGDWHRRYTVARDLFMLSFYFAGINLTDLLDARLDGDTINFVRKKTVDKKRGEKGVSLTIQPEAREIIDKYITRSGKMNFGYQYADYKQFRSYITKGLNKIGEEFGFHNKLMFYSARKTFVQFGQQLGIPLYVLEYAVGQSIKEAKQRPIFDYMRVMRFQADLAIRKIIDYLSDDEQGDMPIPEWAK